MTNRMYGVALRHDKGSIVLRVCSSDAQGAKETILNAEKAPENAVIEVYRCFENIDEVKRLPGLENWFSKHAMQFFRTRISRHLYAGRYFVTSEENPSGERRYSVRKVVLTDRGVWSIETIGNFHQYASHSGAHRAARKAAFQFLSFD